VKIKSLLKTAVVEVPKNLRDLPGNTLRKNLEETLILCAIKDGEKSPLTSRKKIFRQPERAA